MTFSFTFHFESFDIWELVEGRGLKNTMFELILEDSVLSSLTEEFHSIHCVEIGETRVATTGQYKMVYTASGRQIRFFFALPFDKHFFSRLQKPSLPTLAGPLCGNNTMEMQCIFHAGKSRTPGTKPDIGQSCNARTKRDIVCYGRQKPGLRPAVGCLKFQNLPQKLCCSFEKLSRLLSLNF